MEPVYSPDFFMKMRQHKFYFDVFLNSKHFFQRDWQKRHYAGHALRKQNIWSIAHPCVAFNRHLGLEILQTLLTINPVLAESISAEALCLPLPGAAGPKANITPLYCLSRDLAGRKILALLLEKNPKLTQTISCNALCLERTTAAGKWAYTSAFSYLSSTPDGLAILDTLGSNNPTFRSTPSLTGFFSQSLSPTSGASEQQTTKHESNVIKR